MSDSKAHKLYQFAWHAHNAKQHQKAMSLLEQAISLAESKNLKSVCLATKGGFLLRNGDYDKAVSACKEAVLLVPKNYHALTQMGLAQMKMGLNAEAVKTLEMSAEIKPEHTVLTVLAQAQLSVDPSAAKVSAKRALELEPSWSEAKAVLDVAEASLQRMREETGRGVPPKKSIREDRQGKAESNQGDEEE